MTTKTKGSIFVQQFLKMTPLQLLEYTATEDPANINEAGERSDGIDVALHWLAKILLADDAETMRRLADDARRELISEFF